MDLLFNHRPYIAPSSSYWTANLSGQKGGGVGDVFKGLQYQRGAGALGNIFRSIASFAKPLAKSAIKKVATTGVKTALNVAQDALQGRNIGEAFEERGKEAGLDLLQSAQNRMAQRRRNGGKSRSKRKKRLIGRGLGHRSVKFIRRKYRTKTIKGGKKKKQRRFNDIF